MAAEQVLLAIGVGVFASVTASVLFLEYARAKQRRVRRDDALSFLDDWQAETVFALHELRRSLLGHRHMPGFLLFWEWHETRMRRKAPRSAWPTLPSIRWSRPSVESFVIQHSDVLPRELRWRFLKTVGVVSQLAIALESLRAIHIATAYDSPALGSHTPLVETVVDEMRAAVNCADEAIEIAAEMATDKAMRQTGQEFSTPTKSQIGRGDPPRLYPDAIQCVIESDEAPRIGYRFPRAGRHFEVVSSRSDLEDRQCWIVDAVPAEDPHGDTGIDEPSAG